MFRYKLKEQIEYKGLIVKELASRSGVSKRTIDTYLDNRAVIPNAETAVKLAKALDTTVEYLTTGEDINCKTASNPALYIYQKYKDILYDLEKLPPDMQDIFRTMIHTATQISKVDTPHFKE